MEIGSTYTTENSVIVGALLDSSLIPDMQTIIRPFMFQDDDNRKLWSKITSAASEGHPLDLTALVTSVPSERRADYMSLMGSSSMMDTISNAGLLRLNYVRRQCTDLGSCLLKQGADAQSADEPMTMVRTFLDTLEGCYTGQTTTTIQEAVAELADQLEEIKRNADQGKSSFIPTGFQFLDHWFKGGLRGGNVMVLAARPGVGKTSVMIAMMKQAVVTGHKAKIYSLEMSHTELAEKVMYNLGGLQSSEVLTGTPDWTGRWAYAERQLEKWGLYIEDGLSNVDDIASDIVVSHAQGKCDIAFIDYLGLMTVSDAKLGIYQATCEKTRKIKKLALSQRIPIVLLCQLNRDSVKEQRDPDLQDLRDSGSIEQDADKIVLLSKKKLEERKWRLKMILGKHRQGGGVGEYVFLTPNSTYSAFEESDEEAVDYSQRRREELVNSLTEDLPF